jgi:hypothetical protein
MFHNLSIIGLYHFSFKIGFARFFQPEGTSASGAGYMQTKATTFPIVSLHFLFFFFLKFFCFALEMGCSRIAEASSI